jgi:hypothetical protein
MEPTSLSFPFAHRMISPFSNMTMRPIRRAFNSGRTCLSNVRSGTPKIAAASARHTSNGTSRSELGSRATVSSNRL